jgi:predicted nucleic acid-binding Zn ribbon protein
VPDSDRPDEQPAGVSGEPRPGDGALGNAAPGDADSAQRGPELARAVLDAALGQRAARRRSGSARGAERSGGDGSAAEGQDAPGGPARRFRPRGYTGPGPDPRDPQPFGAILDRLVKARGWQRPAAEARVFGSWAVVVGEDVAAHCRPVTLTDGELAVEAESTAWATQLRLLSAKLLVRIAGEVGSGVVTRLKIHGPVAPSWARGQRRVRGRGPRDTYG